MPRQSPTAVAPGVPRELADALFVAGGPLALARILQVSRNTVQRWKCGARPLDGAALFAVRAYVRHWKDYC
jgi:hypothetical protein